MKIKFTVSALLLIILLSPARLAYTYEDSEINDIVAMFEQASYQDRYFEEQREAKAQKLTDCTEKIATIIADLEFMAPKLMVKFFTKLGLAEDALNQSMSYYERQYEEIAFVFDYILEDERGFETLIASMEQDLSSEKNIFNSTIDDDPSLEIKENSIHGFYTALLASATIAQKIINGSSLVSLYHEALALSQSDASQKTPEEENNQEISYERQSLDAEVSYNSSDIPYDYQQIDHLSEDLSSIDNIHCSDF